MSLLLNRFRFSLHFNVFIYDFTDLLSIMHANFSEKLLLHLDMDTYVYVWRDKILNFFRKVFGIYYMTDPMNSRYDGVCFFLIFIVDFGRQK